MDTAIFSPAMLSVAVQSFAIVILFLLLVYSTLQKPSSMQKHVSVLTIASILFLGGYMVRLYSTNVETAMVGATISYMGQPFAMLSAMMLISTFYGYRVPKWLFFLLALFAASVPVEVFTNRSHFLFYATVEFDDAAQFSPMVTTHGPLYNLNLVYVFGLFVADIVMIIRGYLRSQSRLKRSLSVYSVLMILSGVVGYVPYFLDLTGGYDTTMLGVSLGAAFLSILFFRCRIFDVVDKAKDYALDNSSDGLVVLDDTGRIAYRNHLAEELMKKDFPVKSMDHMSGGTHRWDAGEHNYEVWVQVISRGEDVLGKGVKIHDITESVHHQAQLEQAVRETTEHLETVQRTIFASLASVVEARSLETGDHIKRVSKYTDMIARSLRDMGKYTDMLTEEYISKLTLSAPLHDLGKIAIPDAVLLKPGRLTPEEFEVIKTHAAKGADIIEKTLEGLESEEYIELASRTARYHHEWWDGTGYPAGLKGEEIPLPARIVALADCYDALTSRRCYKEAFPDGEAMDIIRRESGTHFDPIVVSAFLHCRINEHPAD